VCDSGGGLFDDRGVGGYPLYHGYQYAERYRSQQFYPPAPHPATLYPHQFAYRVSPYSSPILTQRSSHQELAEDQFIRPLSQVEDDEKRSGGSPAGLRRAERLSTAMASLSVNPQECDPSKRPHQNGPFIQRSTSEKVPNRSELMSQVQRTAWARHTTK
jgi:hypothetical protein